MSLQERYPPNSATGFATEIGDIGEFDYLGPYDVDAWSDTKNVGKLCEKCHDIPWDEIAELRDEEMRTSWLSYEVRPSDFMEGRRACAPSCVCSYEFQDSDLLSLESSPKQTVFEGDNSNEIQSTEPDLDPAGHELTESVDAHQHQWHENRSIPIGALDSGTRSRTGRIHTLINEESLEENLSEWINRTIEKNCPKTLQDYGLGWEIDPKNPKSITGDGESDLEPVEELSERIEVFQPANGAPESTRELTHEHEQDTIYPNLREFSSMIDVKRGNYEYRDRYGPVSMDKIVLPPSKSGRLRSMMPGLCVSFWIQDNAPTVAYVRDSAHQGCHLCTLILNTWLLNRQIRSSHINMRWANGPDLGNIRYEEEQLSLDVKNSYLFGQAKSSTPPERKMRFGFNVIFESEKYQSDEIGRNELEITDSTERIAKWWVEDCLSNHGLTCGTAGDPVLPSRVIDVQGRKEDGTPYIFQSDGKRARYATLSYCWGKCVILTSNTSNIAQHHEGIPLRTMPKTFRDAITTTLALGLQYLWIDALCILQDSIEDCQRELGSMAQIYAESTVTIAAISGASADTGFEFNRNKLAMLDCRVSEDIIISANLEGQEKQFEAGPIHKRAWCFQEVQISRRLLSCGGKELYFQCRRGSLREGSPLEAFTTEGGTEYSRLFDQTALSSEALYSRWLTAVEAYSCLNITFADDRLPAISGLATRFPFLFETQEETPSVADYLGGLWRPDIVRSLSWVGCRGTDTDSLLCNKYRAPSWSWGAVDGEITFDLEPYWKADREDQLVAECLEAWTIPVSDLAPFGTVRAGRLVMYGPVTRLPQDVYDSIESDSKWEYPSRISRGERREPTSRDLSREDRRFHGYKEGLRARGTASEDLDEHSSLVEETITEQSGSRRPIETNHTILETDQYYYNEEDNFEHDGVDQQTRKVYREVITVGDLITTRILSRTPSPLASDERITTYRTSTVEVTRSESCRSDEYQRRIQRRSSNDRNSKSRELDSPFSEEDQYYTEEIVTRRRYTTRGYLSREETRDIISPGVDGEDNHAETDEDAAYYHTQHSEDGSLDSKAAYIVEKVTYYNDNENHHTYETRASPSSARSDGNSRGRRYIRSENDSRDSFRGQSQKRGRQISQDFYDRDTTDHPSGINASMVHWDSDRVSRDVNCICLLLTPSWGLILSPIRKPGTETAGGVYQRVGTFCDGGWKHRRREDEYREGHPWWENRVVTIL